MISFQDAVVATAEPHEIASIEFWQKIRWIPEVVPSIAPLASRGETRALAQLVRADLKHRQAETHRRQAARRLDSRWSLTAFPESERCRMLSDLLGESPKGRLKGELKQWLKEVKQGDALSVGEMLLMTEFLAGGAKQLKPAWFAEIWQTVLQSALTLAEMLENTDDGSVTADERLVLQGELPWRMGLLFDPIEGARDLRNRGAAELSRQLLEFSDTDGIPFAALLPRWDFWLAAFTRSLEWSQRFGCGLWNAECDERFRDLVVFAASLLDGSGGLPFVDADPRSLAVTRRAIEAAGLERKSEPARLVRQTIARLKKPDRLPSIIKSRKYPNGQSDWARAAHLRTNWSPLAASATVLHHGQVPAIDVRVAGQPLMSGDWGLKLKRGNRQVAIKTDWTCLCWNSDADGDYAEFQSEQEGKYQIERQVFLSRKEHFLLLADSIRLAPDAEFAYELQLPLAGGVSTAADEETREVALRLPDGQLVRVFPLSLEQDRVLNAAGQLVATAAGIELHHQARAALWAPMLFSWNPEARKSSADWRRLTVTEDREILSPSQSAAFRLRFRKQQYLFCRRLNDSEENQAVLGYHHPYETVIASLDNAGDVNPLLLVE